MQINYRYMFPLHDSRERREGGRGVAVLVASTLHLSAPPRLHIHMRVLFTSSGLAYFITNSYIFFPCPCLQCHLLHLQPHVCITIGKQRRRKNQWYSLALALALALAWLSIVCYSQSRELSEKEKDKVEKFFFISIYYKKE